MLVGFFALATRRKAVSQIVGLSLVDNGVALVAFLATAGVPLIVELGASLDVLLAVIVLRVLATQLRAHVGSFDLDQLDGAARLMLVAVLFCPLAVRPRLWRRPLAARHRLAGHGRRHGRPRVRGSCWPSDVVHGRPPTASTGSLRADALSAFMVIVIGVIAILATWQGVRYLDAEIAARTLHPAPRLALRVLVQAFVATMLLAVLAANLGVLWVAIEATTVVTTFLVGHRRTRSSLEASWKYIVICSVGIAMAFLGTVLVYLAALHAAGHGRTPSTGRRSSPSRTTSIPGVMRLAFALIVLGYGTKVGLAPMHSWLPDAHSQAPAPVSALMSGVLLTVAFYAILRFKVIADGALGPTFPRTLLVIVGLLSLLVAASLLLTSARLQAHARVPQRRAHGSHRPRRRGRLAAGHRRGPAPHPGPRPGQGGAVPGLGRDPPDRRHQRDRARPGPAQPPARPWGHLRVRTDRPTGLPTVQPVRERAQHASRRVPGGPRLGRGRLPGVHGRDLRCGDVPWTHRCSSVRRAPTAPADHPRTCRRAPHRRTRACARSSAYPRGHSHRCSTQRPRSWRHERGAIAVAQSSTRDGSRCVDRSTLRSTELADCCDGALAAWLSPRPRLRASMRHGPAACRLPLHVGSS